MSTGRLAINLPLEASDMQMTPKIPGTREIDGAAGAGIATLDVREVGRSNDVGPEADLRGEIPEDGLAAPPDLVGTTTARSPDLDLADAAQTEPTAARDHVPPNADAQNQAHGHGDAPGPRLVYDPPPRPERESELDPHADGREAPTGVSSELVPNPPSLRADSSALLHILMPKRRRCGSRNRWRRARKKPKRTWPRKRRPALKDSLCLASTLTWTNAVSAATVLGWTEVLIAAVNVLPK